MLIPFEFLLVDVDRTLYPFDCQIWDAIGERIHQYIQQKLALSEEDAMQLRINMREKYQTTLQGLHTEFNIDEEEYLRFVHHVDLSSHIPPNPQLQEIFASLPQKKIIFTNSTVYHATRVLEYFSIRPYFEDIIDVTMITPYTKFQPEAFPIALERLGNPSPKSCVMIDDEQEIINNAISVGMRGILVNPRPSTNGLCQVSVPSINHLPEGLLKLSEKCTNSLS